MILILHKENLRRHKMSFLNDDLLKKLPKPAWLCLKL